VNEPVQKLLGVALAVTVQGNAALFTALWLPGAVVLPILAAWWLHEWIEAPALRWGRAMARRGVTVQVSAG
jgi:peptidoglycan/LPS O-acetylase OafA/YrhL